MSILTYRELEFLAGLSTSWRRLYWNEIARLMKEDDDATADTKSIPSFGSRRPVSVIRTETR